jgi:hypothetical protein
VGSRLDPRRAADNTAASAHSLLRAGQLLSGRFGAATRLEVARAVGKAWGWHFFQAWTAGSLAWEQVTALVDPMVDETHDRRVIMAGVSTFPDDVDRHTKETLL